MWEHIEIEDTTPNQKELNSWPQTPKLNVIKDDYDAKTKEENTWNPHWKNLCDGDPKFFFGVEENNTEDGVPTYFAGTLTNDIIENFTAHWYDKSDTRNEDNKSDGPSPQLDPKKIEEFVDYSFQNWGWSSNKQFMKNLERQRQIMQLEARTAKTDRVRMLDSSLLH